MCHFYDCQPPGLSALPPEYARAFSINGSVFCPDAGTQTHTHTHTLGLPHGVGGNCATRVSARARVLISVCACVFGLFLRFPTEYIETE